MPRQDFPIILTNDVQIVTRTEDGFYIIKYKNKDGNNSVIWLPDGLDVPCTIDTKGSSAIKLTREFILGKLKKQV